MVAAWYSYTIIFLGMLFALLYKYTSRNYDYWKKRNVYFVKPFPIVGSILPVLMLKTMVGEWLGEWCSKVKADYFGLFVFDRPVLIVNSSKLVKSIIQKDFAYFEDRSVVTNSNDSVMNEVMFFKKSPDWRQIRAKISPFFTSGKLKAMFPLIVNEGNEMTKYMSTLANIPNVDAKEIAAKYSTNVIARCAFAVDAGSFKYDNAEFRGITREMFGFRFDTSVRQFSSWLTPGLVKLFRVQFFHSKIIKSCKRIFFEVLNIRKESGNVSEYDLVKMLMDTNEKYDGKYFTDDAMVGHAIQFLAAGFETVSSALSFALFELAHHPEIQEKLRNEILDFIEKENGLNYSAVHDLKYLNMVVCETLRKYPVFPFLDRTCKSDYKVQDSDLIIEKGTTVYIPIFGLHYNPQYFPDPHKFDPERFVDKSKINNDGIYYFPFGDGPRICVGERFGLIGVKIGLAQILSKYRIEKSSKTPTRIEFAPLSIILQSKIGVPLTFVPL